MSFAFITSVPWLAVGFRLLLMVALWQGPIPWVHQHHHGEHDCRGLGSHIAQYHHDQANAWDMGWHWHFIYLNGEDPTSPDPEKRCSGLSFPLDIVRVECIMPGSEAATTVTAFLSPDWERDLNPVAAESALRVHLSFLETYSLSHASERMLCRMLC